MAGTVSVHLSIPQLVQGYALKNADHDGIYEPGDVEDAAEPEGGPVAAARDGEDAGVEKDDGDLGDGDGDVEEDFGDPELDAEFSDVGAGDVPQVQA